MWICDSIVWGWNTKHVAWEMLQKSFFAELGFLMVPGSVSHEHECPGDQWSWLWLSWRLVWNRVIFQGDSWVMQMTSDISSGEQETNRLWTLVIIILNYVNLFVLVSLNWTWLNFNYTVCGWKLALFRFQTGCDCNLSKLVFRLNIRQVWWSTWKCWQPHTPLTLSRGSVQGAWHSGSISIWETIELGMMIPDHGKSDERSSAKCWRRKLLMDPPKSGWSEGYQSERWDATNFLRFRVPMEIR